MDITKLIIISSIVFVTAVLLYIIAFKNEKLKKIISKLNGIIAQLKIKQSNKKGKEIEQDNSQSETKQEEEKPTKKKNKKSKKNANGKLKPSKAVTQIRPTLLPPNKEMEENDLKLLEMKKRPQLQSSPQKALDFKYGANNTTSYVNRTPQNNPNNLNNANNTSYANINNNSNYANMNNNPNYANMSNNSNYAKNNSNYVNMGNNNNAIPQNDNPLNRDRQRQFEDIKNFIQLPENISTPQKGIIYDGKDFKYVDKVDYSQNNGKLNPPFKISNSLVEQANKYSKDDYLSPEQENIDLNKLPKNLRKMLIQNIFDRRNYD